MDGRSNGYFPFNELFCAMTIFWRRKWQSTPVFLPGESHGRRSLVGYSPQVTKSGTQPSDFTFTFTFRTIFCCCCCCICFRALMPQNCSLQQRTISWSWKLKCSYFLEVELDTWLFADIYTWYMYTWYKYIHESQLSPFCSIIYVLLSWLRFSSEIKSTLLLRSPLWPSVL